MIGYTTVGTNDLPRALDFYDGLMGAVGARRLFEMPKGGQIYGHSFGQPMFAVTNPYDEQPATVGNGTMIALVADSRAQVDTLYAKAIELGAVDEGAPGLRGPEQMGFYGAYFRDPDGNKLCVHKIGPA